MDKYTSVKIFNFDPDLSWHQVKRELEEILKDYHHANLRVFINKNGSNSAYINFTTHDDAIHFYDAIAESLELGGLPASMKPILPKNHTDLNSESPEMSMKRLVSRCVVKSKQDIDRDVSEGHQIESSETRNEDSEDTEESNSKKVSKFTRKRRKHCKSADTNLKGDDTSSSILASLVPTRTLYVGGLIDYVTEEELLLTFGKYGIVTEIILRSNRFKRTYAFIKYFNMDMAIKAMAYHSTIRVCGKWVKMGYTKMTVTECLWVGGIGPLTDEKLLLDELSMHGTVKKFLWPHGKSYAYALYSNFEESEAAMNKLNGMTIDGMGTCLRLDYVSEADMNDKNNFVDSEADSEGPYKQESDCKKKRLEQGVDIYKFDRTVEGHSYDSYDRMHEDAGMVGCNTSRYDKEGDVVFADDLSEHRSPSEGFCAKDFKSNKRRKDYKAAYLNMKQDTTSSSIVSSLAPTRTLYVGRLNEYVTEKDLRQTFEKYGRVIDVLLKPSHLNTKPYAFIKYFNMDMALNAIENRSNIRICGEKCIKLGYSRTSVTVTHCLWVGGIGPLTDEKQLLDEFSKQGTVDRFLWPRGKDYAYVVYSRFDGSERAMRRLNGKTIDDVGTCLRLDYVSQSDLQDESNFVDSEAYSQSEEKHDRQVSNSRRFECDVGIHKINRINDVRSHLEHHLLSLDDLQQWAVSPLGDVNRSRRDESQGSRCRGRVKTSSQDDCRQEDGYESRDIASSDRCCRSRSREPELIESWNRSRSRDIESNRERYLSRHEEATAGKMWHESRSKEPKVRSFLNRSSSREIEPIHGRHQSRLKETTSRERTNLSGSRELAPKDEWHHSRNRDCKPREKWQNSRNRDRKPRQEWTDRRSTPMQSWHQSLDVAVTRKQHQLKGHEVAHREGSRRFDYQDLQAQTHNSKTRYRGFDAKDKTRNDHRSRSPRLRDSRVERDRDSGGGRRSKSKQDRSPHAHRKHSQMRRSPSSSGDGSQSRCQRLDGRENATERGSIDSNMDQLITSTTSQNDDRCFDSAEPAAVYPHIRDGSMPLPQMSQPPLLIHTSTGMMHVPPAMFGFHPPPPFGFLPPASFPLGMPLPLPNMSLPPPPMGFLPTSLPGSVNTIYSDTSAHIPPTSQSAERKIFKDNKTILSSKKFPVVWSGALLLKSKAFVSNFYLISGSIPMVHSMLTDKSEPECPVLDISQRLNITDSDRLKKLEDQISRAGHNRYCILLTSPADVKVTDDTEGEVQQCALASLGAYLRNKECAAVIFLPPGENEANQASGVMHVFPQCKFSTELLRKEAPELCDDFPTDDHLLVLVVRDV